MQDIRYMQRFENYEKSFLLLKESLFIKSPSLLERAGIIQFFETSFELAWKLMKDYLEYMGYDIRSPRDSIKTGFQVNIIIDGDLWLDALMDRNLTVHTYDEAIANEVYLKIKNTYFLLLKYLYNKFKDDICLDLNKKK